ncbi:hypothetical protein [Mycobacterium sp. IS-2888]|uniref:hypothetical protein n=1 Tax=Mycobacterium sp. IS-2888 TaxID=1834159 RepID=UPI001115842D|nr:hypothetical protein [Mycobacterium sp. IS-2888]
MSDTLEWRDNGEIILLTTGIPTGPHRFDCQAERGKRQYGIQHQGDDGWMVLHLVGEKVIHQEMCESLEAAKEQAELWEATHSP